MTSHVMRVDSNMFHQGETMPVQLTCDGVGMRPPLTFSELPEGAKTLAVVVRDPDAPGGTFTHWIVWNIPATVASVWNDELPAEAVEGRNSTGEIGWYPACPPQGDGAHRYVFTMYALDDALDLPSGADYDEFVRAAEGHVLAQGTLTGTYER